MITDVIVEGCRSVELRRRMLLKDRTLDDIEEIAAGLEGVDSQMHDLTTTTNDSGVAERVFDQRRHSDVHKHLLPDMTSDDNIGGVSLHVSSQISYASIAASQGIFHHLIPVPRKANSVRTASGWNILNLNVNRFPPPSKRIRVVEQQETQESE